jgi:hypothetical protein
VKSNQRLLAGLMITVAACLPPTRGWLESDMTRHMLLQLPALLLAGALLASGLPRKITRPVAACNAHGTTGLLFVLLVLSFWMIPRALDEAVLTPAMALAKFSSLLAAGAALQQSWRPAGTIVQLFFIGNWAAMNATIGLLYQQVPSRLCNVYLLDDQQFTGKGLVVLSVLLPVAWVASLRWQQPGVLSTTIGD